MGNESNDYKRREIWKSLSEAGLVEISFEEFPDRIKEAKNSVMSRLAQLLKLKNDVQERQSVAHSLGTLKTLEATFRHDDSAGRRK